MEQIQMGDQTIRFDRERTLEAYSSMQKGDAERCGCADCLNFAAQRKAAYPEDFRALLDRLGIDAEKEGEVYECGPEEENGRLVYGGWFYFAGEIVVAGERLITDPSGFQYWFREVKRLPDPQANFGEKVIAIEFVTRIPRVISQ